MSLLSRIGRNVCVLAPKMINYWSPAARGGYRQQPRDTIRIPIQGSRYDTYRDTHASRYMGHDTIRIAIHGLQYNTYPVFLGLYFQKFKLFFNVVSYPGPHVLVV